VGEVGLDDFATKQSPMTITIAEINVHGITSAQQRRRT